MSRRTPILSSLAIASIQKNMDLILPTNEKYLAPFFVKFLLDDAASEETICNCLEILISLYVDDLSHIDNLVQNRQLFNRLFQFLNLKLETQFQKEETYLEDIQEKSLDILLEFCCHSTHGREIQSQIMARIPTIVKKINSISIKVSYAAVLLIQGLAINPSNKFEETERLSQELTHIITTVYNRDLMGITEIDGILTKTFIDAALTTMHIIF